MKVVTVVGARPQFIKASSLSRVLQEFSQEILVHTGQHYDDNMSKVFFDQLQLPTPDYYMGVGSSTHGKQTAKIIEGMESILEIEKPDLVLVYGDTNSTLAGSLAAAKLNIPVAHVEAGLRSFNKRMPEEINRILTDHMSSILFCPTMESIKNLQHEGIERNVHWVGDIMFDSVLHYKDIALRQSVIMDTFGLTPKRYNLATIHRQENTDDYQRLKNILEALRHLNETVVIPLHPRTAKLINQWNLQDLLKAPHIIISPPLSYLDMLNLIHNAKLVLTDSGGIQKEAYMLKVPCLTLRDETEWVETVQAGWNHITGVDTQGILKATRHLVMPEQHPPLFGDGRSAEKTAFLEPMR
ncbi:non-hydrolyzing UDP-N-acetylglucosamine 2-epimerase [Paenibacillus silviterrae]|uniref:non-hydrolyzing UDP-N-acetylglucosamine 2-epimerase n=1 Tax=Paenibacillus silviterrae TaxID=3242194 RepID=UPI0025433060|nr:UDP-N-acetylglucosamine 2-epimerase (non-hydrolyzing) [Paenibacillus chinjuensis]